MKDKIISWSQLREQYAGKLIALSKDRDKVLAAAKDSEELLRKLREKKIKLEEVILSGPMQEPNRIYVYRISVSIQNHNRRQNSGSGYSIMDKN